LSINPGLGEIVIRFHLSKFGQLGNEGGEVQESGNSGKPELLKNNFSKTFE
jgi:hypothetical protein